MSSGDPGGRSHEEQEELADLERLAVDLAREAGTLIARERPDVLGVATTKSSETDIVTVMDARSERLLRARIAERRPDDAVLGEEGGTTAGRSGLTWVVDPIDGTVNYLYGIPAYAVSVAVVRGDVSVPGEWTALAGAVSNPVLGEVFHARVGGGAWLQASDAPARRIVLGDPAPIARALVGTGFGYIREDRARAGATVAQLLPHIRDIRRIGSAALDLCHVAAGRLDAYYEAGLHAWDLAAGALVLTEAGGVVTGLRGRPPSQAMVIAAAPALHADLHDLLLRYT